MALNLEHDSDTQVITWAATDEHATQSLQEHLEQLACHMRLLLLTRVQLTAALASRNGHDAAHFSSLIEELTSQIHQVEALRSMFIMISRNEQNSGLSIENKTFSQCINRYNNKVCPVTQDEFKEDDIVKELQCGHIFCSYAIDPWLQQNRTCPVCKANIAT